MFRCERCGSRYSAMHAVAIETCPRCQIKERVSAPLTFKAFDLGENPAAAKRSVAMRATAAVSGSQAGDPTQETL